MNPSDLPDTFKRRMRPADRKSLGKAGQTAEEACAAFVAKSETDLQNQMANLLSLRGIAFMRQRMDKRATGTVGWPDITCCISGAPVAFEAKYADRNLEDDQKDCIRQMKENGWHVFLIRDLKEFRRIVTSFTDGWFAPSNITDVDLVRKKPLA